MEARARGAPSAVSGCFLFARRVHVHALPQHVLLLSLQTAVSILSIIVHTLQPVSRDIVLGNSWITPTFYQNAKTLVR